VTDTNSPLNGTLRGRSASDPGCLFPDRELSYFERLREEYGEAYTR